MDEKTAREIAAMVENAMVQFNEGMKRSEELSVRIGRRTSQIIRVGAGTVALLAVGVLFLTFALKQDMGRMSERMDEIAGHMAVMKASVAAIGGHIGSMDGLFSGVAGNTAAMSRSVAQMTESVESLPGIAGSVAGMRGDIGVMGANVAGMHQQMGFLSGNVGAMGRDVDRMSTPMKFFPFSP